MTSIDRLMTEASWNSLSKREKLQISRQRAKLDKNLGSIADLNRLPAAMFVVDVMKEHIAVKEAIRLNIPVFAMVDTNSDPNPIDFVIPANDDASKSIEIVIGAMTDAIKEGLAERKADKDSEPTKDKAVAAKGAPRKGEGRARVKARKEDEGEETSEVENSAKEADKE
jgi:small subunit ribosomal protein S2